MHRSVEALIDPKLMIWARQSASMSLNEAAHKLGIPSQKLQEWEDGRLRPTVKQLRKMASIYKQSFAAFFLPAPPDVFRPPVKDYRRLYDGIPERISSALSLDVRSAMDRRAISLELYDDLGESPPKFTSETAISENPEIVGEEIRELLKISIKKQETWKSSSTAFGAWRSALELSGILVFQSERVSLSEMRGYSIADFPLPIISVNNKDAPAGRVFSLLHELVHIMLQTSGICDMDFRLRWVSPEQRIEVFCNHVAGAALIPKSVLLDDKIVQSHKGDEWEDYEISQLSKRYAVSREVVLRRLLTFGRTTEYFYEKKRRLFQEEIKKIKMDIPIPYSVRVLSRIGQPFARLVLNAHNAERITSNDLSDYLGINLKHLDKISQAIYPR